MELRFNIPIDITDSGCSTTSEPVDTQEPAYPRQERRRHLTNATPLLRLMSLNLLRLLAHIVASADFRPNVAWPVFMGVLDSQHDGIHLLSALLPTHRMLSRGNIRAWVTAPRKNKEGGMQRT